MLWDGLTFFGFDKTKLERIRGKKVSFSDKFRDFQWVIISFVTASLIIFIVVEESHKYGEVKQQNIQLVVNETFIFDNTVQKLLYAQYFYMDELIPKV